MRKLILGLLLFCAANSHAVRLLTYETEGWVPQIFEVSTHTYETSSGSQTYDLMGILDYWSFEAIGATATFQLQYGTVTRSSGVGSGYKLHLSSVMSILPGQIISDDVRWLMFDTRFVVGDVGDGGTLTIRAGWAAPERLVQ